MIDLYRETIFGPFCFLPFNSWYFARSTLKLTEEGRLFSWWILLHTHICITCFRSDHWTREVYHWSVIVGGCLLIDTVLNLEIGRWVHWVSIQSGLGTTFVIWITKAHASVSSAEIHGRLLSCCCVVKRGGVSFRESTIRILLDSYYVGRERSSVFW